MTSPTVQGSAASTSLPASDLATPFSVGIPGDDALQAIQVILAHEPIKFDNALKMTDLIISPRHKSQALQTIGLKLLEGPQPNIDRSLEVAQRIQEEGNKSFLLRQIVRTLLEHRQTSRATVVANTIPVLASRRLALTDIKANQTCCKILARLIGL